MKELLLNLLASSLGDIGETKLVAVLQQLHDRNPGQYKVAILGGLQLVLALEPIVLSTGTMIDDVFIKSIREAIETSAANNNEETSIAQLY